MLGSQGVELPPNRLSGALATTRFQKEVSRWAKEMAQEVSKLWPSQGFCHWNMGITVSIPCGKCGCSTIYHIFKCAALPRRTLTEMPQNKEESKFVLHQMRRKTCYQELCVVGCLGCQSWLPSHLKTSLPCPHGTGEGSGCECHCKWHRSSETAPPLAPGLVHPSSHSPRDR